MSGCIQCLNEAFPGGSLCRECAKVEEDVLIFGNGAKVVDDEGRARHVPLKEIELMALQRISDIDASDPECLLCEGTGWVCEDHPEVPWDEGACCGGAGMPCCCNPLHSAE